jgi:PAS domain S-box-containing protein
MQEPSDVLNRKQYTNAIWQNPDVRSVLDSIADLFIALDRDYNIAFINRALAESSPLGYDGLVGKNHFDLWPDMRGTLVEQEYGRAFAEGAPARFEFYYPTSKVWVDVSAYPNESFLHIYFRDITQRKNVEKEQAEREAWLRQLLDALPHIAWATAPTGEVTYINRQWHAYTGDPASDLESISGAIHPEDLPKVVEFMAASRSSGRGAQYDLRLRRQDGEYRWLRVKSSPLTSDDGNLLAWIGTSTDIHEEKLAMEAVKESEDHYRFMVDSNPQVPWLADSQGQLVDFSERWLEMTGLTREEALTSGWVEVPHPEDLPRMLQALEQAASSKQPLDVEHRARMADGSYRWMRTRAVPRLDPLGEVLKWYGSTEDIHDRRTAEDALRHMNEELERRVAERTAELVEANEKLQDAYREAESFSYTASHDLRAPLRAVISTSRLLTDDHRGELSQEARTLLDQQAAAAQRLATLIDDLLAYSRLGKQEIRSRTLDLTTLARRVTEELRMLNPEVTVEIEPGLKAKGDESLIRVVLQNLIENAMIYSPSGGTIHVGRNGSGEFFVADQGIGFEMEYSDKIFLPFQRLHRDDDYPGTGIGLANVKKILERHGGTIRVESKPDEGSVFYFSLRS